MRPSGARGTSGATQSPTASLRAQRLFLTRLSSPGRSRPRSVTGDGQPATAGPHPRQHQRQDLVGGRTIRRSPDRRNGWRPSSPGRPPAPSYPSSVADHPHLTRQPPGRRPEGQFAVGHADQQDEAVAAVRFVAVENVDGRQEIAGPLERAQQRGAGRQGGRAGR